MQTEDKPAETTPHIPVEVKRVRSKPADQPSSQRRSARMSREWDLLSEEERERRCRDMREAIEGKQRCWGQGVLKLEALLTDEHRREYYVLLRDPGVSLTQCAAWVKAHNYDVGLSSIQKHRRRFRMGLIQTRQSAEMAHVFVEVARQKGAVDVSEACVAYVEHQIMETLFTMIKAQAKGQVFEAELWADVLRIVGQLAKNRETIEKIRVLSPPKNKKVTEMSLEERKEACRLAAEAGRLALGLPPA